MKSVLLTRSIDGNKETIEEISKYSLNLRYIDCPLIKYKKLDLNIDILNNYSNIIVTSKYAANILANYDLTQDIWVVGNKSKQLLGKKVAYTAQNIEDLIKHFPPDLYQQTIYLSSNEITQDLPDKITRHIVYNVEYLNELPLPVIEEFKKNSIDFILLYSQNSAKTLIKLLNETKLQNSLVIAISSKVANIIRPFIKNVVYCDDENPNNIIKLLVENAKVR
ncbi:MAG TPA: uroporphyrinogen-III synthase [Rickettsia endosymbiont of Pyrocoelia pectoralis]|nr:uroporphyrinogen-III synthase [Rickettsia endosymbiont of Pyrocoelia pectoralis]